MFVTGEKNKIIAAASVMKCLPFGIYESISRLPLVCLEKVEEILLIAGKPIIIFSEGKGRFVNTAGELTGSQTACVVVNKKQINEAFRLICDSSVYSCMDDIKQGFITIEGGHRVGVCGSGVRDEGQTSGIRDISALNIRIAREIKGCAEALMPYILKNGTVKNTIIISPPGCGKTTMLRDIARIIGSGLADGVPLKTAIVDERGEIAAPYQGTAQKDIGCMSMVMDKIPKAECMTLLLRSMAPSVVITDEIGTREDSIAIKNLINSGVSVIASAHAATKEQAVMRTDLKDLILSGGFEVVIELSKAKGPGSIRGVHENAS